MHGAHVSPPACFKYPQAAGRDVGAISLAMGIVAVLFAVGLAGCGEPLTDPLFPSGGRSRPDSPPSPFDRPYKDYSVEAVAFGHEKGSCDGARPEAYCAWLRLRIVNRGYGSVSASGFWWGVLGNDGLLYEREAESSLSQVDGARNDRDVEAELWLNMTTWDEGLRIVEATNLWDRDEDDSARPGPYTGEVVRAQTWDGDCDPDSRRSNRMCYAFTVRLTNTGGHSESLSSFRASDGDESCWPRFEPHGEWVTARIPAGGTATFVVTCSIYKWSGSDYLRQATTLEYGFGEKVTMKVPRNS